MSEKSWQDFDTDADVAAFELRRLLIEKRQAENALANSTDRCPTEAARWYAKTARDLAAKAIAVFRGTDTGTFTVGEVGFLLNLLCNVPLDSSNNSIIQSIISKLGAMPTK